MKPLTEDFFTSCHGKARHVSFAAARRTLRRRSRARELEPYHCRHCGGWHIGSRQWGTAPGGRQDRKRRLEEQAAREAVREMESI